MQVSGVSVGSLNVQTGLRKAQSGATWPGRSRPWSWVLKKVLAGSGMGASGRLSASDPDADGKVVAPGFARGVFRPESPKTTSEIFMSRSALSLSMFGDSSVCRECTHPRDHADTYPNWSQYQICPSFGCFWYQKVQLARCRNQNQFHEKRWNEVMGVTDDYISPLLPLALLMWPGANSFPLHNRDLWIRPTDLSWHFPEHQRRSQEWSPDEMRARSDWQSADWDRSTAQEHYMAVTSLLAMRSSTKILWTRASMATKITSVCHWRLHFATTATCTSDVIRCQSFSLKFAEDRWGSLRVAQAGRD